MQQQRNLRVAITRGTPYRSRIFHLRCCPCFRGCQVASHRPMHRLAFPSISASLITPFTHGFYSLPTSVGKTSSFVKLSRPRLRASYLHPLIPAVSMKGDRDAKQTGGGGEKLECSMHHPPRGRPLIVTGSKFLSLCRPFPRTPPNIPVADSAARAENWVVHGTTKVRVYVCVCVCG